MEATRRVRASWRPAGPSRPLAPAFRRAFASGTDILRTLRREKAQQANPASPEGASSASSWQISPPHSFTARAPAFTESPGRRRPVPASAEQL